MNNSHYKRTFLSPFVKISSFLVFLSIIAIFQLFPLPYSGNTEYVSLSKHQFLNDYTLYEGDKITLGHLTINEIISLNSTHYYAKTTDDLFLLCNNSLSITTGGRLTIRGISYLVSQGHILVIDYHSFRLSPYYLSVPGIVLFLVLFFLNFKINWFSLTIYPRRKV